VSPVLARLGELMRTPESAAVAVALRTVFDPPLCRQRRR
jgi:hypothetical protein